MEELNLFRGDNVLIKGKKRKDAVVRCVCIYIYIHIHMHKEGVCVYIYIYIHKQEAQGRRSKVTC